MKTRSRCMAGLLGASILLLAVQTAQPRTFETPLWEDLVEKADLVAVVECQTAGGIVARFRIIDSWKGPENGSELTLHMPPNPWGDFFPVMLCGERFLIAATKRTHPPAPPVTSGFSTMSPLWWRNFEADYEVPSVLGQVKLPDGPNAELFSMGSPHSTVAAFKEEVKEFLNRPPPERELRTVKARFQRNIEEKIRSWQRMRELAGQPRQPQHETRATFYREFNQRVQQSGTLVQLLQEVRRTSGLVHPNERAFFGNLVEEPFRAVAGPVLLGQLEELHAARFPLPFRRFPDLHKSIQTRLSAPPWHSYLGSAEELRQAPPRPSEIEALKTQLQIDFEATRSPGAFITLSRYAPEFIAEKLADWEHTGNHTLGQSKNLGYKWGSLFGWLCGADRPGHLQRLLKARDPEIRVAAAVYLAFEDEEKGVDALRQLSGLSGSAGAWAALNLARRGDKSAIPRLLELFRATSQAPEERHLPNTLRSRTLVLLSNSANQSGLPQPVRNPPQYGLGLHDVLNAWWEDVAGEIQLSDPWLPLCRELKIE